MYRRELIQIIGAAATAAAQSPAPFLSAAQLRKLVSLTEKILPGAKQTKVAAYIDLMLQHADEPARKMWTSGIDKLTNVEEAAREEMNPKTEAGRFFVVLKRTTIEAHYLLLSGGHNMSHGFAGCTHANHAG